MNYTYNYYAISFQDLEQDLTKDLDKNDGSVYDKKCSDKPMTHREANILDVCMDLMLTYFSNVCYTNGEL